jgi:hypothetical protein
LLGATGFRPRRFFRYLDGLVWARLGWFLLCCARLDSLYPDAPQTAGILRAMLLGDRSFVDQAESVDFQKTGVSHVLVLAGLHVGALALFLFWLGNRLRLPRTLATVRLLATLFAYIAVVEQRAPVLRADGLLGRRVKWLAAAGLLLASIVIATHPFPAAVERGALGVDVLDVAQGDSILVISPRGSTLLIDGGAGEFSGGAAMAGARDGDTGIGAAQENCRREKHSGRARTAPAEFFVGWGAGGFFVAADSARGDCAEREE